MNGRTVGNLLLMTLICIVIFIVFMAIWPAHAQGAWWNWPYAPWRIQPGFTAPPVLDPYAPARAPIPYAPPPAPPPLGWLFGRYTVCLDPPGCKSVVVSVGVDGLNVRVAPNGPIVLALANGTPVIPLQRAGDWVLVAPACALVPTWTWSITAGGVPLSVCL
jgi:hypothetical protein